MRLFRSMRAALLEHVDELLPQHANVLNVFGADEDIVSVRYRVIACGFSAIGTGCPIVQPLSFVVGVDHDICFLCLLEQFVTEGRRRRR